MSKRSKTEVETIARGAAMLSTFWSLLTKQVNHMGGTADDLHRLTRPEGAPLIEEFARRLVTANHEFRKIPPWKTVMLGTHESANQLRAAFTLGKFRISEYASRVLKSTPITDVPIELELLRVSVRDLGFFHGATSEEIYHRATELGLSLCPAEVGPQLRLHYANQQMKEYLLVGMDPMPDPEGELTIFVVNCDAGGSWLNATDGRPERMWHGDGTWIFVRRK
jgi:hypothetical protein